MYATWVIKALMMPCVRLLNALVCLWDQGLCLYGSAVIPSFFLTQVIEFRDSEYPGSQSD